MTYQLAHHVPTPPDFVPFDPDDLHRPMSARFEKMVRLYPQRVAVEDDRTPVITYEELNQAANRVAHALLARDDLRLSAAVALLFDFSPMSLVTVMAAWKAGCMVLALEPTYPESRNQFMLHDSGARLLLTDGKHWAMANAYADSVAEILNVEAIINTSREDQNPGLDVPLDTFSNLTYTSGSTGQPKGVIHTHRKEMHIQYYANLGYCFNQHDRSVQYSSLGYLNWLMQVNSVLMSGGTVLPYDMRSRPLEEFARWLRDRRITYLSLVPTIFRRMCLHLKAGDQFPDMRVFGTGGERARASDLDAFKRWFGNASLKFNYATSETSTITQGFAGSADDVDRGAIPIGYPFGQQEVLLVDESDNLVSFGEEGQIVVRSRFFWPGYLNRPEATAEKFSVDADDPGLVTFRTGDIGRQVEGGWYVHRGRRDNQIKVRGFRVEAGEIETALVKSPDIREAVVITREDAWSAVMLAAYIVPENSQVIVLEALREALRQDLPDYMIPARFVVLDPMPYTLTGKIDLASLPEVEWIRPALEMAYVAPRNETEERIAAQWAAVLNVDRVGVFDPFLDLGGHSLLATELVTLISHEFGAVISIEAFFAASTVAQMAALINEQDAGESSGEFIQPVSREEYRTTRSELNNPLKSSKSTGS